ncbi:NHLP bacteriocin system secretion protein [Massilia sp. TS11]|uniref:NHLP bacteriocin system secretion protein n=1 Tax=Massilia sp. TS11 TaxID=2908003 RepID=UPI001EDB5FDD|nr:NHLP bacteriocin system secretion protein [Massilia sp. TS11]MCG2586357.1 NHLP bacteriocin system secretion protein [Massilia sp. TS11]
MSTPTPTLPPPEAVREFDRHVARVGWRGWGMLALLGAILAAIIVWSAVGDVPTRVRGSCIIMHPAGVTDVTTDVAGRITALLVKPGDSVSAGQEVALVATPDLYEKIQSARQSVADLEAEARVAREQTSNSVRLAHDSLAEQRAALQLRARSDQKRIALLEQQVDINNRIRKEGLITERAAATTPLDLADARAALEDTQRKLVDIDKQEADLARKSSGTLAKLTLQIQDARRALAALENQEGAVTRLRAPTDGKVVEVKAGLDAPVKRDMAVLSLERIDNAGRELEAVMYVSAADGKKIAAGQDAELLPSHAKREEHGMLRARVRTTSAYPASPQGLLNTIANPDLMRELARGTATYEVRLQLLKLGPGAGPGNPYQWTSAGGNRVAISSGALCQGEILVQHEKPVAMVLPIFRSTVKQGQ